MYKKRFDDEYEQAAYETACDCMRFGGTFWDWDDCGIDSNRRVEVWKQAKMDVVNNEE